MISKSAAATVVAGFGHDTLVLTDAGELTSAKTRNRRLHPVAGDRVHLLPGGIIDAVAPRTNQFARTTGFKTRVLAANVTQVAILAACEPSFSDELICRFLIAAEHARLPALIVLNKADLRDKLARSRQALEPFNQIGAAFIELAGKYDAGPLRERLQHERTLLVGQSGMGKSTLVKTLVPQAVVRIQEISRYLDSGRQSTTAARLYRLDEGGELVDTPGVSEFGLGGLPATEVAAGFREFAPYAGQCRFLDCRHVAEPGCALKKAAAAGQIHPRRLELYQLIVRLEAGYRATP